MFNIQIKNTDTNANRAIAILDCNFHINITTTPLLSGTFN